jgi:uncharacterized membrane protein
MIQIIVLVLIGIIIGWYIPKPSIVDTIVSKAKDAVNSVISKFKS